MFKRIALALFAGFVLTVTPVTAQEKQIPQTPQGLPPGTVMLPLVTLCSPLVPDLGLFQKYGEVGFIEGDASFYIPGDKTVNGKLIMYMKPGFENNTFTLMFQVGPLYCMISSGKNVYPVDNVGDPT
jgi:hypothetical protein